MKSIPKYSLIVLAAVLLVAISFLAHYFFAGGLRSRLAGFSHEMQSKFDQVNPGDLRNDVVSSLGSPLRSQESFCLPSGHDGYEESLARAKSSNAVAYDLWVNGINWYYCIGFDGAGLVAFKAEGND